MPPKRKQRSSNDMHAQTYYLPNTPPLYNYYPPPDQHKYVPNYSANNPSQGPLMTAHEEAERGAFLLQGLKENYNHHQQQQMGNAVNNQQQQPGYPLRKKHNNQPQRIFIHRVGRDPLEKSYIESDARNDVEDSRVIPKRQTFENKKIVKEEVDGNSYPLQAWDENKPNTKFSNADIIFANGNNREKRRVELFENYSELHKFKERKRGDLFQNEKDLLEKEIALLTQPQNFNTEFSSIETYGKDVPTSIKDLCEKEQDIIENRDYELTRLRHWRRYRRNQNVKNYYKQSVRVYQNSTDEMIGKLEKLKNFFNKQKNLLKNLDKEYVEINSNRAEKFYTGFKSSNEAKSNIISNDSNSDQDSNGNGHGQTNGNSSDRLQTPEVHDGQLSTMESSETDTAGGFTSSNNVKTNKRKGGPGRKKSNSARQKESSKYNQSNNSVILTSILEGFAPILTNDEFQIVTNDETRSKHSSGSSSLGLSFGSDTEGGHGSHGVNGDSSHQDGGRTTTSSRAVREARDRDGYKDTNAATLNKIMKQYVTPGDLDDAEVEEDLKILRGQK